jgi:prevent-host-death family protein
MCTLYDTYIQPTSQKAAYMEVNVKEARSQISSLLDRTQKGEEIVIVRRGKKTARLVPIDVVERRLPDLSRFRRSIAPKGKPLSETVLEERGQERY